MEAAPAVLAVPRQMSLDLSTWPYPYSLAVSGFTEADFIADVSDEEEPIPGKFMGGKNGRLLRPAKKPKLPEKGPEAELSDNRCGMLVDDVAGSSSRGICVSEARNGMSNLFLDLRPQKAAPPSSEGESEKVPKQLLYSTAKCCTSKFSLPPTLHFSHTTALSQPMPISPHRFDTTSLTVVQKNSATGLYYRIGPGAVAFRVVLNVFTQSGLVHTHHPTRWNVLWAKRVSLQEWAMASEYQKVNHFPGTRGIARKDNLAKNINRLRRQHPDGHFSFVPLSFIVPPEMQAFEAEFRRNGGTWILKPAASSCGKGIRLINQIPVDLGPKARRYDGKDPVPSATWVLQQYIDNPFLIDGYKFDLRIYVLVTSFDPLRIYVFNEGLVRFATEKYKLDADNISNTFMHLTNYSLNKHSASYVSPAAAAKAAAAAKETKSNGRMERDDEGEEQEGDEEDKMEETVPTASKWTLTAFMRYCQSKGIEWSGIQAQMHDIIIKTFLSVESEVLKEMRTKCQQPQSCFELFGWDMMLDKDLKMWLIEVNLMPSLSCTTALDKAVKYALVEDTLTLAGPLPFHRTQFDEAQDMPVNRHPRMDDFTFQDPTALKTMMAQLSDSTKPFLDLLTPEHKLLIMETEDELSRRNHFTRIFPTAKTWARYGKFFEGPRPNNLVLARWEKEKKKGTVTLEALGAASPLQANKGRRTSGAQKASKA